MALTVPAAAAAASMLLAATALGAMGDAAPERDAGWIAFKLEVDGEYKLSSVSGSHPGPYAVGVALFDERGGSMGGVVFSTADRDSGARVVAVGEDVFLRTRGVKDWSPSVAAASGAYVGTVFAVLWGTTAGWTYSIEGAATPTSSTSGTEVFLFDSMDFGGGRHASARAAGVGAFAIEGGERTLRTEGTLVGLFTRILSPQRSLEISVDTPTGPRTCPCSFWDFEGSNPPGDYTFRLNGTSARAFGVGDVIATGVVAHLPG